MKITYTENGMEVRNEFRVKGRSPSKAEKAEIDKEKKTMRRLFKKKYYAEGLRVSLHKCRAKRRLLKRREREILQIIAKNKIRSGEAR